MDLLYIKALSSCSGSDQYQSSDGISSQQAEDLHDHDLHITIAFYLLTSLVCTADSQEC